MTTHTRQRDPDALWNRLRSLGARRALVVTGYVLLVVTVAIAWIDPPGPVSVLAPIAFLAGIAVAFVLRRLVRYAVDPDDDRLDERLISIRGRVYHRAYFALTWAALAAILALMLGVDPQDRHLQALFYGFGLTAILTPSAMLAWDRDEI
jgi:hypothetical protein